METIYTSFKAAQKLNIQLSAIISIQEEDEMDYDLDYDQNDFYYELQRMNS